jgi:hypothetical protein
MTIFEDIRNAQIDADQRRDSFHSDCENFADALFGAFSVYSKWTEPFQYDRPSNSESHNPPEEITGKFEVVGTDTLGTRVTMIWGEEPHERISGLFEICRTESNGYRVSFLGNEEDNPSTDPQVPAASFEIWKESIVKIIKEGYLSVAPEGRMPQPQHLKP